MKLNISISIFALLWNILHYCKEDTHHVWLYKKNCNLSDLWSLLNQKWKSSSWHSASSFAKGISRMSWTFWKVLSRVMSMTSSPENKIYKEILNKLELFSPENKSFWEIIVLKARIPRKKLFCFVHWLWMTERAGVLICSKKD